MKRFKSAARVGGVVIVVLGLCATVDAQFHYSTDIGSDLDISDPITPGPSDAGDIYIEPFGPLAGGLIKNDGPGGPNPGFTLAGTVAAPFGGFAGQPAPGVPPGPFIIGGGAGVVTPSGFLYQSL